MKCFAVSDRTTFIRRIPIFVLALLSCALINSLSAAPPPPPPDTEFIYPEDQLLVNSDLGQSHTPSLVFPVGGDQFRIEPYGSLWGNIYYASSRTNPGPFTLWFFSEEDQGEPSVDLDVRRSRIGARFFGETIHAGGEEYESRGRVEVDFFGQFLTENRAGVRLRHVYWEVESESTRYLIGQTNDVISPLLPGTLNFVMGRSGGGISGSVGHNFSRKRRFLSIHKLV